MADKPSYEELEKRVRSLEKRLKNQAQAEERLKKRVAEVLWEDKEKFRSIMEAMNDAVCICSSDCRIEYMNPMMIKKTGNDATGRLCHKAINDLDEPCPWCVQEDIQQGKSAQTEILSPKDGRNYLCSHSPIFHKDGSISKMTIYSDITRLKGAQEALKESEEHLRSFMENAKGFAVYRINVDPEDYYGGHIIFVSPSLKNIIGVSPQDEFSEWFKNIHEEDLPSLIDAQNKSIETGTTFEQEFRLAEPGGEWRWIHAISNPVLDSEGKPKYYNGIILNITSQKQAEEALRKSEKRLNAILDATTETMLLIDREGIVYVANQIIYDRLGTTKEEIVGKRLYDFFPPDVAETRRKRYNEVFNTGKPVNFEDSRKGMIFEQSVYPILDDGDQVIMVAIFAKDTTERKRVEEALRESEVRYRNLVEDSFDGILIQKGPKIIFSNKRLSKMLGYNEAELIGRNHWVIYHPDYQKLTKERAQARIRGEDVLRRYEVKLLRKDGSWFYGEINALPISFPSDKENGIQVWVKDIDERKRTQETLEKAYGEVEKKVKERTAELLKTNQQLKKEIEERKQAEEDLKNSEQRLTQTINFLPDATMVIDLEGKVVAWNRAIESMTGIKAQDILGKGNYEYAIPFYGERRPILIDILNKRNDEIEKTYRHVKKTGESMVSETYDPLIKPGGFLWGKASLLYDHKGEVIGAIESIRDITDKKVAEEALRESEEKYRALTENAGLGIFQVTRSGKFLMANQRMADIFGYDSQEDFLGNVGNAKKLYVNLEERPFILKDIDEKGQIRRDLNFTRKDGAPIFCTAHIRSIRNEDGESIYEGFLEDITDRKRAAKELRLISSRLLTVQERERKRISLELHDELGQSLLVLKLQISSIEKRLGENQTELRSGCQTVLDHIVELIGQIRRICRDLSPVILDDLGLTAGIRWLATNVLKNHDIDTSLDIANIDKLLTNEQQLIVFRIFQETFTNIVRHACASLTSIGIKKQGGEIFFVIEDNGKGFDVKEAMGRDFSERGIGLSAIKERAWMLGGSINIWSQRESGTKLEFRIPIKNNGKYVKNPYPLDK